MNNKLRKSTITCSAIIILAIILVAVYFIYDYDKNERHVFQTYDEALDWGMKEFSNEAVLLKDIKVNDGFNNTNLVFYAIEDTSKVYISKIIADKSEFQYERLTPTYSWNNKNEDVNSSFDVPITINDKVYYVLIGKVDKSYKAYSNEEELSIDLNRIFIKINPNSKNSISFKKST